MLVACRNRCPAAWPKPPTRLLFSMNRMPMARQQPALASTGTAPDRRRLLSNFSAKCELLPLQPAGAVPFHRDPASPASRLRRNIPPNFAEPSRRRNGEPVSASIPKPALFAFRLYGSNLTAPFQQRPKLPWQ